LDLFHRKLGDILQPEFARLAVFVREAATKIQVPADSNVQSGLF